MKSLLILVCLITINSAYAQTKYAEFSFSKPIQELGKYHAGGPVYIYFQFVNSGKLPLVITDSKVDCSCTQVEFPKEPLEPGAYGTIKVTFDTTGKMGWQYRKIRLYANTKKPETVLEFRLKVE